MNFEKSVFYLTLLSGLPGTAVATVILWTGGYTLKVQLTLTLLILLFWIGFALIVREKIVHPLQTASNLVSALREGDYSFRAKTTRDENALTDLLKEINALSERMRKDRFGEIESAALLAKVVSVIDSAIFTFDENKRLRFVNSSGQKLLGRSPEDLTGKSADDLALSQALNGDNQRIMELPFAGQMGRWEVRRSTFREEGLPNHLLVLTDLSRTLRDEERQVWQRLIRVIGHELNNSLAPIKSIGESLSELLNRDPLPNDWQKDVMRGLNVITGRADALARFMNAYSQLARLPQPQLKTVRVSDLISAVIEMETRIKAGISPGPDLYVQADREQMEQALINLLRNAVEASLETNGSVELNWTQEGQILEINVCDEGPGLGNTTNLFVPLFTTKQGGSGIGLVLSRQIVEAHNGSLTLTNRENAQGCKATIRLPIGTIS